MNRNPSVDTRFKKGQHASPETEFGGIRANPSAAGKKGGAVYARNFKIRTMLNRLLSMEPPENIRRQMAAMGFDEPEINNGMAMVVGVYRKALEGDVAAATFIRDTIGQKPKDTLAVEVPQINVYGATEDAKQVIDGSFEEL